MYTVLQKDSYISVHEKNWRPGLAFYRTKAKLKLKRLIKDVFASFFYHIIPWIWGVLICRRIRLLRYVSKAQAICNLNSNAFVKIKEALFSNNNMACRLDAKRLQLNFKLSMDVLFHIFCFDKQCRWLIHYPLPVQIIKK